VITSDVLDEAMARYMPQSTADRTVKLAEQLAFARAREERVSLCRGCGLAAVEPDPLRCSVCGSESFEVVTDEMLQKIASMEGGLAEETTYDGRKLTWSQDAKRALWTMKDAYQRRRAKARVEKSARGRKLATVTLDFARHVIEEETGVRLVLPDGATADGPAEERGLKLVARDAKRNPLVSAWPWSDDAVERLFRAPAGFMRTRLQARIEAAAAERRVERIDLALVEEGLDDSRRAMEEFVAAEAGAPKAEPKPAATPAGKCPFHDMALDVVRRPETVEAAREGLYLNEVGVMSALRSLASPPQEE
jgi:hypothetical protein